MSQLEILDIPGTIKTPTIRGDATTGKISMSGRCVPENAVDFFIPVKTWNEKYIEIAPSATEFQVELDYFNTSSSIILLNVFRLFTPVQNKGMSVNFIWVYVDDDLDMKEAGQEYKAMLGGNLTLIPKPA